MPLTYTTGDAIASALLILACVAGYLLDAAYCRRRDARRRDLERILGAGRYSTGCPRGVGRLELDEATRAHARRRTTTKEATA